ncbi:unnamed protein product [Rotaria socialis]|uniref:MIP18 family-like domain-containing protein n=1 Tax=Rotaria socialis TaxID=392032 RepID=A0A818B301_9BILA|nr:unnamed protein product [Rotaria socialis]CAF3413718.1 unnamed protein product [Rotaria socialis]CAF3494030.1 unnamed protein product [Rotaria socialis]CAF3630839.1 unnamed protein product [Rotaria socialis]CAF3738107.1 unnamed protein product [Rotaria socialis]
MELSSELQNLNPTIYECTEERTLQESDLNNDVSDNIDRREVFDLIRTINDPEHPLTLEELHVVDLEGVTIDNEANTVQVQFRPTIPHCSMATLIGLSIRAKLIYTLPTRYKVGVNIYEGAHIQEVQINKQLNDKERVTAALENKHLCAVVNRCIATPDD